MQIAPHLHRIGNDIVAAYLIVTPDGITVIDAGLPGHWRDLQRELVTLNRSLADIRGIILTHGDSDHLGFAERLRRETGTPIHIHPADADRARGGEKPKTPLGRFRALPVVSFAAYALRKGAARTTYVTETTDISDGQVLDLPGSPRVIGLPGHSPGSVAILSADVRALFVGDALTTRNVLTGDRGPRPAPFTDEPAQAVAILDRLRGTDAEWILPGHGAPWRGTPDAAIDAVQALVS